MHSSGQGRQTAFSVWLRAGRWPRAEAARGVEVKFNPWHDPRNGRFTFAPGGPRHSGSGGQSAKHREQDIPPYVGDPTLPKISNREGIYAWAAKERAKFEGDPDQAAHFKRISERVVQLERDLAKRHTDRPSIDEPAPGKPGASKPGSDNLDPKRLGKEDGFVEGFGEGLYDAGKDAVTGLYTLATTNPLTTARNIGVGIAGAIDTVLDAEDTPTYVHFNRTASLIANASPHDWGYALGKGSGNLVLTVAPGVAAAKVAASMGRVGEIGTFVAAKGEFSDVWKLGVGPRGEAIEHVFGHNLARNFPVIDKFKRGVATSIKSVDLDSSSYLVGHRLRNKLTKHVDEVSAYRGTKPMGWAGIIIREKQIRIRRLQIVIPHGGTAIQEQILRDIVEYGSSLPKPVKVHVNRFNKVLK